MSLYIPNIKLPKDASFPLSICITKDGTVTDAYGCPLMDDKAVELPPHGRLIDADALFRTMNEVSWYSNADRDEVALEIVLDAKTIIEAEGGADG